MARYDDCESCAFHEVEEAICDCCVDGDQWEDENPFDILHAGGGTKIWKAAKVIKLKRAA